MNSSSVSTHLYGAPDPRDALTQSGFEELKRQLTKLYDAPTHPWEDEAATLHLAGERSGDHLAAL